ncbi:MAG TPA: nicotinate phosphoribosyltransferase [Candidatus Paceibacterota bacterium]|nr:nicotinate phosphoribosyltransferase [Candidatus Paceibacterota bacterium]
MMIKSLLDTDLYKLTMMQAVYHQFPSTKVSYKFYCRSKVKWTQDMVTEIENEIHEYCNLQFKKDELEYLKSLSFIKKDFVNFLSLYKPSYEFIYTYLYNEDLYIFISGPWIFTIMFEVPILAIVNEVYFKHIEKKISHETIYHPAKAALERKIVSAKNIGFKFADFGTRRRHDRQWQEYVVDCLSDLQNFVGTSNVYLAKILGIKPIGTMAHEWIMAGSGMNVQLVNSQSYMLQKWADEYRGDLGIALSDTYGIDAFLKDFDLYFAKLYDGVRQDSGDPIVWAEKIIKHYKSLEIDPKTKTLIFSDGLNIARAKQIYEKFKNETNVSFGIGTNLTNDFTTHEPINIVIKMTKCNDRPTAKLSDEIEKEMCEDRDFLNYLKSVIANK